MKRKPTAAELVWQAKVKALEDIAERNKDHALNPREVVDVARDPNNPLHDEFEWDNGIAGERYRLLQAEGLIRRVHIHVVRKGDAVRHLNIRAYQSRPKMRHREGGYEQTIRIMSDEDKQAEMLAQALSELEACKRRFEGLQELAEVWNAIGEALAVYHKPPPPLPKTKRPGRAARN